MYKFKSKNAGDVIMLEPYGRRVLEIIGKGGAHKGIILPEQMPAAIAALQAAIEHEEADRKAADKKEKDEASAHADGLGLRQRTLSFIHMLQSCRQSGDEIMWGV